MSFEVSTDAGVVEVAVLDELVLENKDRFRELVEERLDEGERAFLVDFSEASYIDSSGLGALVSLYNRIREEDGELWLSGLGDDIRTLFELTRLDSVFHIAEERGEAIQALQSGGRG